MIKKAFPEIWKGFFCTKSFKVILSFQCKSYFCRMKNKDLYIYNSLSRKKEKFEPLNPPFVGLYVCGPTVYSPPHLGNVRTFLSFDIVNRYLLYLGYKVRYVRNITDVGHITNSEGEDIDRIGEQAKKENLEPMEIVQKYTLDFHEVTHIFNMLPPDIEPTATGHVVEQIEMVQRIIDNGYAYVKNYSVYFDIPKFVKDHSYGELSGQNIEEQLEGHRELDAQNEKQDARDFAIWKYADKTHPMRWNSPWGEGVPGWHLECSVMSTKYLGQKFDIHGGGMDLKFPHHECEIAQSIGADGSAPVRYWMHGNMLTMNGQKMSKSLGNSVLPRELITGDHDLLEQGYSPMSIRFFMLQAHYTSTLDLSNEALKAAEKGYKRLMEALKTLENLDLREAKSLSDADQKVNDSIDMAFAELNDDFNTPKALARLFELVTVINSYKDKREEYAGVSKATMERLQKDFRDLVIDILGLQEETAGEDGTMDGLMQLIIDIRQNARTNKDWTTSDLIRDKLNELELQLKDGKDGTTWTKL